MSSSPRRNYFAQTNFAPVEHSSSIESASPDLKCSTAYASNSDNYNTGYINNDPIVGHNISLINAHLVYRLLNNGPLIIESKI